MGETGRTIYYPGNEERFELVVECNESVNYVLGYGDNRYSVEKVKWRGENILFNPSTGDSEFDPDFAEACTKVQIIRKLSNALFAFPDSVRVTFNVALKDDELVEIPRRFVLRSISTR